LYNKEKEHIFMERKDYRKPETFVVLTATANLICDSVKNVSTSDKVNIKYGGGGNGAAMSRQGGWNDDDE